MNESKVERVEVNSKILGKKMPMLVYLPIGYDTSEPLPILYFLHARGETENAMFELEINTAMDQLLRDKKTNPMIIVCPRMDNSRGINSSIAYKEIIPENGNANKVIYLGRYEDYFMQEVIPFVEQKYNVRKDKRGRYIGGASIGGYTALHNAFRHQDMFSKVGGHMPAIELTLDKDDAAYYQEADVWDKYDPIYIAKHSDISSDIRVYLDAGDQDEGGFYEGCSILQKILQEKGISCQKYVFPGHHNLEYIQSNIKKYLQFYGGK